MRRFHEYYPITALLLLLVAGFYVLTQIAYGKLGGQLNDSRILVLLGSLYTPRVIEDHEIWRLLSCTVLHGSLMHIFFNGWVLFDLGKLCEPLLSSYKFFSFYVICGIGGSLARVGYSHFHDGPANSVGASGALLGLIGVLLAYSIKERLDDLRRSLVSWLIMIGIMSLLVPRIDHSAHIGGFLTGCVLGLTVGRYTTSDSAERWRIPSYIAGLAYAVSLGWALWNYFSYLAENS